MVDLLQEMHNSSRKFGSRKKLPKRKTKRWAGITEFLLLPNLRTNFQIKCTVEPVLCGVTPLAVTPVLNNQILFVLSDHERQFLLYSCTE